MGLQLPKPVVPSSDSATEWRVLLAATSLNPTADDIVHIRQLLDGRTTGKNMDWQALIQLADQHGLSSLLYQNLQRLPDVVPSASLESIRKQYDSNLRKSLFLARELIRVLDCADALGIEVIAYKGIALAERYYGDMALRQAGDVDLFVRKRDIGRIKSAVRELEYAPRATVPDIAEKHYIDSGYELTFDSPAGKNVLELQWALQPRFYAVDFDMDGLFDRSGSAVVAGRTVKVLSTEDCLLVLSLHAAKHVWSRLIWTYDIARVSKQENVNWDSVQSRARELGIARILHVSLLLAQQFFGATLPAPAESAIRSDRAAGAFADEIAKSIVASVSYEEEKVSYFRLMMRLRERPADRLRFLTRLAFTPGPGEWQAVRLPKSLSPLYRVVRLARLAAKFTRG